MPADVDDCVVPADVEAGVLAVDSVAGDCVAGDCVTGVVAWLVL